MYYNLNWKQPEYPTIRENQILLHDSYAAIKISL